MQTKIFIQNNLNIAKKSNLQGAVDFQTLFYGIQPALNENFGWTEGVSKLYTTLAQDLVYKDATRNVIFLDNHDMTRFFTQVKGDVEKQKMLDMKKRLVELDGVLDMIGNIIKLTRRVKDGVIKGMEELEELEKKVDEEMKKIISWVK